MGVAGGLVARFPALGDIDAILVLLLPRDRKFGDVEARVLDLHHPIFVLDAFLFGVVGGEAQGRDLVVLEERDRVGNWGTRVVPAVFGALNDKVVEMLQVIDLRDVRGRPGVAAECHHGECRILDNVGKFSVCATADRVAARSHLVQRAFERQLGRARSGLHLHHHDAAVVDAANVGGGILVVGDRLEVVQPDLRRKHGARLRRSVKDDGCLLYTSPSPRD